MVGAKVVIGIDFGTTYSGVSWVLNEGQRKIRLIKDWPDPWATNSNTEKVPTVISYKNGKVENWGYEVGPKEDAFRWFKILLEPGYLAKIKKTTEAVSQTCELLLRMNKTAETVVADFLEQLWRYTKNDIRKSVGDEDWESIMDIDVILTVPAMWTHAAREKTKNAAFAAGLPKNLELVTEPEAAALATLRDKRNENSLSADDVFLVCDAGGGTVDLISYRVTAIDPLRVEECAVGQGDLCGSVFLDSYFERSIMLLVGEADYKGLKEVDRKKMLRNFEYGIKRSFSDKPSRDYLVDLRGVKDNEAEGITDESISLSHTMIKTVFDHVIGQVKQLVQDQVSEVQFEELEVRSILLVGGFGSNRYLHHELETAYRSKNISVLQVNDAWSSICRGACMWGLEHARRPGLSARNSNASERVSDLPTVSSRKSQYSYGVMVLEKFDPYKHDLKDRLVDEADGTAWAKDQMRWLLRRGDRVVEGRVLSTELYDLVEGVGKTSWFNDRSFQFQKTLYSCKEVDPPSQRNGTVKELCKVQFSIPGRQLLSSKRLRGTVQRGNFRQVYFGFNIRLGSATLGYSVHYRGEEMGCEEVTYLESP